MIHVFVGVGSCTASTKQRILTILIAWRTTDNTASFIAEKISPQLRDLVPCILYSV